MVFIEKIKNLIKAKYPTLNRLEIIADNLLSNLKFLQSIKKEAEIIPVLKANAYGHGLKEVAKILNQGNIKRVAVDSFPESQIVNTYFKGKVLIIGEMSKEAYSYLDFKNTEIVVYNVETLKILANFRKKIKVHLFYNSGMNREGIKDIDQFLREAKKYLDKVSVVGFCSHLASAESDEKLNQKQASKFFQSLDKLQEIGYNPKLIHLGNSAGLFTLKDKRLNAYRVGLSFYGYHTFTKDSENYHLANNNLKPALRLISKIVSSYNLQADEIVSYKATYKVQKDDCQIVTIPFGYFEGLSWNLSNSKLKAKIKSGEELIDVELVGRISMNLSCWRVLSEKTVKVGDELILVSEKKNSLNSLENIAKLSDSFIYESLTRFRENIRRVIK